MASFSVHMPSPLLSAVSAIQQLCSGSESRSTCAMSPLLFEFVLGGGTGKQPASGAVRWCHLAADEWPRHSQETNKLLLGSGGNEQKLQP